MKVRLSIAEMMRSGWLYYSDGYRTKKPELGPTGFPIMRVAQVLDGYLGPTSNPEFVRDEYKKKIGQKSSVNGDVILTTKGTVGRMARIGAKDEGYVYSPQVCFFRVLEEQRIDRAYLFYAMAGDDFRQQMQAVSTQTDMAPYINLKDLGRLEIDVPEFAEQRQIASILGALDDKIELNRRMNGTLEALAQAVFKEWFVEKAEEGWVSAPLGAEFDITMGQSPPGDTYNETGEGMPFYQGRTDFGFRFPVPRVYCTTPTRLAKAWDTLVSVRAPVGSLNMAEVECAIGRGVAAIRHKSGARSFTYHLMNHLRPAFELFEASGTVFGSMGKKEFHGVEFTKPWANRIQEFEDLVGPMDERVATNEAESRTLTALRDTLLPKLMRGEVRVKEKATT